MFLNRKPTNIGVQMEQAANSRLPELLREYRARKKRIELKGKLLERRSLLNEQLESLNKKLAFATQKEQEERSRVTSLVIADNSPAKHYDFLTEVENIEIMEDDFSNPSSMVDQTEELDDLPDLEETIFTSASDDIAPLKFGDFSDLPAPKSELDELEEALKGLK
jgi:hypothetical protein